MLFLALLALASSARAEDYSVDGPHKIDVLEDKWTDAARAARLVPYKIYYPTDLTEPAPVVIVSHGLGGSRDGYAYIGRHLASHGYIAVHVTHDGSDTVSVRDAVAGDGKTIMEALKQMASDPANIVNRPKDISFAVDQLIEMNKKDGPLKGRVDVQRIGVDGHSFGAYTAMAVAGQTFGKGVSFRDERIKAAVVMSPSAPRPNGAKQYESITIPILLMTGTRDDSPIGTGGLAADRPRVFDLLTNCTRYLLVFDGGDHMVFSGRSAALEAGKIPGTGGDRTKDPQFHAFVKASTVAFFDAYLKGDDSANHWLSADDGGKATLGSNGTWKHQGK